MSCDLLPFRKDFNLLAAWLAGTNPTQFRRKIGEQNGRRISVHDMCNSIQLYRSNSFVMKVKLMYGAVAIYQRQVNHLYGETIRIMGHQYYEIKMFRKHFSSIDTEETIERKKKKTGATVKFTDIEVEPLISSDDIVELFSQSNTSVRNLEDITMRETMVESTRWETCRYINVDENFGTEEEDTVADFFDIGQSTIDENDISSLPQYDAIQQTGCTIEELPSVEESVAEFSSNSKQTFLPASEDACLNVNQPLPYFTDVPELPPFIADGDCEAQSTQSSYTQTKPNKKRSLVVNQKIYISNKEYAQQLQNHEWTLRCKGPREDIVPLPTIRYPEHSALQLLRNPVRQLSHALMQQTFRRNAHIKRMPLIDTDDPMIQAALEGISRRQQPARERAQRQRPRKPETLDHIVQPYRSAVDIQQDFDTMVVTEKSMIPETNVLFKIVSEKDLLMILRSYWKQFNGSVKFCELEKNFRCRQEAAKVFAVLVVLHAKQQVYLVRNPERCSIDAIEKGINFIDIVMQLS